MDPIWCFNLKTSCFVFFKESGYLKKKKSCLQLPLRYLQGSSPHEDLTQLHPHLSNPNEWQLHLSKLQSTSVHPALGITLLTSRWLHPNDGFFMCLHGHQPKNKIAPQTLLVGFRDPQCSCKVFLV